MVNACVYILTEIHDNASCIHEVSKGKGNTYINALGVMFLQKCKQCDNRIRSRTEEQCSVAS